MKAKALKDLRFLYERLLYRVEALEGKQQSSMSNDAWAKHLATSDRTSKYSECEIFNSGFAAGMQKAYELQRIKP